MRSKVGVIFFYLWYRVFGSRLSCIKCGNQTLKIQKFFHNNKKEEAYFFQAKEKAYCGPCLSAMIISCAWCEGEILPGEPITLFCATKDAHLNRAVVYSLKPLIVVGCSHCTLLGKFDCEAHRVPPGEIVEFRNPIFEWSETPQTEE